ncbi:MAG: hypothetical protein U0183_29715 [Polyangiaceae bacterium]
MPCSSCGGALPRTPPATSRGLSIEVRAGLSREGRAQTVLVLSPPREVALLQLVVGAAWTFGLLALAYAAAGSSVGAFALFPLLLAALGLGFGGPLVARGARGLVNAPRLVVTRDTLVVTEGPLLPRGSPERVLLSDVVGTAVERDALVRFVPCIVLRDGRTIAIPRTFERKANAVWVCERVDALVAEARTSSPYRGALPAAEEEKGHESE